jgi:hypothetical protein
MPIASSSQLRKPLRCHAMSRQYRPPAAFILERIDPFAPSSSPDCVALSEKSEPDNRPSIISTSCSGTPISVEII